MTAFKPGDRVYDAAIGHESPSVTATILTPEDATGKVTLRFDEGAWSDARGTDWLVRGLRYLPGYEPEPEPEPEPKYRVQMTALPDFTADYTAEELAEMVCGGVWTLVNSHTGQEFKVEPL